MGGPDASLKVLQSIENIREEMEVHVANPLVQWMVESGADTADNAE